MKYLGNITILLHTSNRPEFLLRALDYYERIFGGTDIRLIILEASNFECWTQFENEWKRREYSMHIEIIRGKRESPLYDRIAAGLDKVHSPYIMFAADDDFYFYEWIEEGVAILEGDASIGTVYGHTLRFELDRYSPFGDDVRFSIGGPENPPRQWLDAPTPAERVANLASSQLGVATTGWYALQRADQLRTILEIAKKYRIEKLFERFFVVSQAALSRTHMLDQVYLARQIAPGFAHPPFSFKENAQEINRVIAASIEIFLGIDGIQKEDAVTLVGRSYASELALMKTADRKRHLRRIAAKLPILRLLQKTHFRKRKSVEDKYRPDERLPRAPTIAECALFVENIKNAVIQR